LHLITTNTYTAENSKPHNFYTKILFFNTTWKLYLN